MGRQTWASFRSSGKCGKGGGMCPGEKERRGAGVVGREEGRAGRGSTVSTLEARPGGCEDD